LVVIILCKKVKQYVAEAEKKFYYILKMQIKIRESQLRL